MQHIQQAMNLKVAPAQPTTFNITTSNTATNTLLIFTQVGDKWEGLDPITTLIENVAFTFTLPQAKVDAVSGSIGFHRNMLKQVDGLNV